MNIQQFDFSVDLLKVILWEYNDAEKLQKLLQKKQEWINKNQSEFWDNWYNDVFNLDTANDFGCAVWSIILDVPLIFTNSPSVSKDRIFGFGKYNKNFNRGNFYSKNITTSSLTINQKRLILKLRYFKLTTDCSTPSVNSFLSSVFGDSYILDSQDMSYSVYVFNESISKEYRSVLEQYDLLPRPAGVGRKIRYGAQPVFGFGKHNKNFNNGNFANFK